MVGQLKVVFIMRSGKFHVIIMCLQQTKFGNILFNTMLFFVVLSARKLLAACKIFVVSKSHLACRNRRNILPGILNLCFC